MGKKSAAGVAATLAAILLGGAVLNLIFARDAAPYAEELLRVLGQAQLGKGG
jgi:hypothetical protein